MPCNGYKHSSIVKAAAELHTTASNVSQIINKLRYHFHDPLFIRIGKGTSPTNYCRQLHDELFLYFDKLCGRFASPRLATILLYTLPMTL
ncbi:LysR family transcriptional regulator [Salmonella enterica]|nr:LysR family transcriptional regulator [Salmonella enterica]